MNICTVIAALRLLVPEICPDLSEFTVVQCIEADSLLWAEELIDGEVPPGVKRLFPIA